MNLTKRAMFALLCAAGLTGASQAADVYMKNHCVYMGFSG